MSELNLVGSPEHLVACLRAHIQPECHDTEMDGHDSKWFKFKTDQKVQWEVLQVKQLVSHLTLHHSSGTWILMTSKLKIDHPVTFASLNHFLEAFDVTVHSILLTGSHQNNKPVNLNSFPAHPTPQEPHDQQRTWTHRGHHGDSHEPFPRSCLLWIRSAMYLPHR